MGERPSSQCLGMRIVTTWCVKEKGKGLPLASLEDQAIITIQLVPKEYKEKIVQSWLLKDPVQFLSEMFANSTSQAFHLNAIHKLPQSYSH